MWKDPDYLGDQYTYWLGFPKTLFKFSKRRNSLQKCFHLFKYIIDHENVLTFFMIFLRTYSKSLNDVNSLHCLCVIPSVLLAVSLHLRALHRFIAIQILFMNIWILWKSSISKINNLEDNLERNLTTHRARECIFRASESTNVSTRHQLWCRPCGFDVCTPLLKQTLDHSFLFLDQGSDIYDMQTCK